MKSKIKIQKLLMKGIAVFAASMMVITPIVSAATSLDDSGYLESTWLEQLLYGTIGSTAKEIEEWFSSGKTTLYISNETQLRAFAEYVNNGHDCHSKEIYLLNNIEVDSNVEWTPIKGFTGTFDGKGYTITGISFVRDEKTYDNMKNVGLFGTLEKVTYTDKTTGKEETSIGKVRNLTTKKFNINLRYTDSDYIGDEASDYYYNTGNIVGQVKGGVVENCINYSDISGGKWVGGIVGYLVSGTITNCTNYGMVEGHSSVGGIVGKAIGKSTISNCINGYDGEHTNQANIIGNEKLGGIVGSAGNTEVVDEDITIENCLNRTDQIISEAEWVGGIIGNTYAEVTTITNCTNQGKIEAGSYVGGIIGRAAKENSAQSSIILTIQDCVNSGNVKGVRRVGGIAGYIDAKQGTFNKITGLLVKCYNEGNISATSVLESETTWAYVGGIVGYIDEQEEKITIKICSNYGKVTGPSGAGGIAGIIGKNNDIATAGEVLIIDCSNEGEVSGKSNLGGIVGYIAKNVAKVKIQYCQNKYSIGVLDATEVGGILGQSKGKNTYVGYCYNSGTILGEKIKGGIVGTLTDNETGATSSIEYCINYGAFNVGTGEQAGGILGSTFNESTTIKECLNNAGINSNNAKSGTILGFAKTTSLSITKCDNKSALNDGDGLTLVGTSELKTIDETKIDKSTVEEDDVRPRETVDANNKGEIGYKAATKVITGTIGDNITVTYKMYKKAKDETTYTEITKNTYLKPEDTVKVEASFNRYLTRVYQGTTVQYERVTKDEAPILKIKKSIETTIQDIIGSKTDNTTTINYIYTVEDGINLDFDTLDLYEKENATIYVTEKGENYNKLSLNSGVSAKISHITVKVDSTKPKISTKVYVENALETGRYTAGKEILFEVTTDEKIKGNYTTPEIRVNFSESGYGKYNYKETTAGYAKGYAKCIEAKINLDGTTTWIYSYQIQEGDEGKISLVYTEGSITDVAGNTSDLKAYSQKIGNGATENVELKGKLGTVDVNFKVYKVKGTTSEEISDTSVTYIEKTDKIKVEAVIDGFIYTAYQNGTAGNSATKLKTATAPVLKIDGVETTVDSVVYDIPTPTNQQKYDDVKTTITYTISGDKIGVSDVEKLKNISVTTTNDMYVSKVYIKDTNGFNDDYDVENFNSERTKINTSTSKTINIEKLNIYIDTVGINQAINGTDVIYVDTTAPTVEITANKSNPTNANAGKIVYTFEFSEKVEGFDESHVTVNNGKKGTFTKGTEALEGLEYTLEVEPTITEGNEGTLQVIVEEGAVKDLVGINNIRQENNITIDKVRPTFTSYEIKHETEKIIAELTFSEKIVDASKETLTPTLIIGGKTKDKESWETIEIYDNNKMRYIYNVSGADGGKVELSFAGKVKDVAGNDSEALNISVENDITLEQKVITNGTDKYSFEKGNTDIRDFTNPTYFVKGDTIKITKISEVAGGTETRTVYTYKVEEENISLIQMKYMKITEEDKDGDGKIEDGEYTVRLQDTETSGYVNISEANLWVDTVYPKVTTKVTASNPVQNNVYGEGSELIIKATTTEKVHENKGYVVPGINVKFGQNLGKFNDGKAEYIQTIENEDGTSTAIYRYVISVGDEGKISLEYVEKSGSVKDLAGNTTSPLSSLNSESGIFTLNKIVADTTVPTVAITTTTGKNPTNAEKIVYIFEFSEKVEGFDGTDITVNNGTKGTFTKITEGLKYTLEVSPTITEGNEGDVQVIVEQNACIDKAGLGNVRAENIIKVDKKAPTVEIRANKNRLFGKEKIKYEFIWSEAVKGFYPEDIVIGNGDVSPNSFVGSGNYYTLEIVPSKGYDLQVNVEADTCTDIAGNSNIASSKHVIPVLPSVTITTEDGKNPTKEALVTYIFKWSEAVNGFTEEDIIVPNGATKETLTSGLDNTYTMKVIYDSLIPLGNEGEVTVAVKENAAQDFNGNYNAYASNTLKIDRKSPILVSLESYVNPVNIKLDSSVDSVKQHYKAGETVTIVATFTENIKGENVSDTEKLPTLSLTFSESGNANGSVSAELKEGNKIIYTYKITNKDLGTLSVKGFTGKVIDAAGNETVVTKRELTGDTIIADAVVPKLVGITAIAPDFEYDELIKDGETKRYGVTSKTRANNTITIVAEYSENVYSLNSNTISKITTVPELKIKFGTGSQRTITTGTVEGNKITYTYNIQAGDNGNLSIVSLNGTVSDIAGNILTTSTTLPTTAKYETEAVQGNEVENITADTEKSSITFSSVTAVNYDDNGNVITGNGNYYREGAVINITATTNEYVYRNTNKSLETFTKDNAPTLNVSFDTSGTGKGQVACINVEYLDNKTIFTYTYTVTEINDEERDNGKLSISIDEDLGYDIALNGNNTKTETKSIYADTVNPLTHWASTKNEYGIEDSGNGTWEVTFSEKLYVYDNINYTVRNELSNSNKEKAPILLVSNGTNEYKTVVQTISTNEDKTKTVITYKLTETEYKKNIGEKGFEFASVSDKAGNLFNLIDQVNPKLEKIEVTSPAVGTYKAGEEVTIVATFNEKLKEDSIAPTLALAFTTSGDAKGTVSQGNISGNTITYTYTITANDNKGDGDNGLLQIKSFAGKGLFDLSDNGWEEENTKTLSGNLITADTIVPVITKVEAKVGNEVIGSNEAEGKTNADTICYVVTFSESITLINKDEIEMTNGKITEVKQESDKVINVTVKTTTEGVQSLIIPAETVADNAQVGGNKNEFFRFNGITVDFTKPIVRFISEYNGGVYVLPTGIGKIEMRPNVEINEDISKIEYNWDNDIDAEYKEITNYSGASDIVIPTKEFTKAGEYTLRVKVTDIAGNITKASKEYNILASSINITAENAGIEASATNKLPPVNGDVLVTVEFGEGLTDNRKVFFKPEGSNEYREINPETNYYRIKENGTVYAEATDKVGNKVFYLHEEKVGDEVIYKEGYPITNIDRIAPTIEFSEVPYGILQAQAIDIEIFTNEEDVDIKYSWDNENWETYQEKIVKAFETAGTHKLYAKATDAAGNESRIHELEIYVSELEFEVLGNIDYWTAEDIVLDVISESNIVSIKVNGVDLPSGEKEYIVQKNGEYVFVVTDEYGNPATTTVTVDKIDKDLPVINEETTTITGNDVTIEATDVGSGIAGYAITKTTEVPLKWSDDKTINTTEDGIFHLWVKDNVGNVGRSTNPVVIDTVDLEIEVTGNPTEWTNKDVELEIKANKELSSLKIGETEIENSRYRVTENGEYVLTATDIYGKTDTMTITVDKIDKVLPEVDENATTISGKAITIVAADDDSEIAGYAISTTTEIPVEWWTNNIIETTEDGIYYVWAKDNAGNVNIGDKVVVVDTTAPIVSFSYVPQVVTVGMPFETTVFTNEDAIISYSWNKRDWVDSEELLRSLPVSKESTTVGRYLLYVKATDASGNASEVQTLSFEVVTMDEIKQPDIIFEDLPVFQVAGVRYVKVSSGMTGEMLKAYINEAALYGKTPEFTKLTEDGKLRTGSEIALNGTTKYIVVVNGDVNCDGKVTLADVISANKIRINNNNVKACLSMAADYNTDGNITLADIVSINKNKN